MPGRVRDEERSERKEGEENEYSTAPEGKALDMADDAEHRMSVLCLKQALNLIFTRSGLAHLGHVPEARPLRWHFR